MQHTQPDGIVYNMPSQPDHSEPDTVKLDALVDSRGLSVFIAHPRGHLFVILPWSLIDEQRQEHDEALQRNRAVKEAREAKQVKP